MLLGQKLHGPSHATILAQLWSRSDHSSRVELFGLSWLLCISYRQAPAHMSRAIYLTSWVGLWKLVDTRSMMKSDMDGSASGLYGYLRRLTFFFLAPGV